MSEAIILAGGFGTRLRHVVSDVPKPMAPVDGKPFLHYVLDALARQGYTHVVLATGYMHEVIESHFGGSYAGIALSYARETSPLGTGGAIVNAMQHCHDTSVTVLNGDTLFLADLGRLRLFAAAKATRLAIVLRDVDDAGRYGAVETDDTGRVIRFREKDPSTGPGLINGGIYQIDTTLLAGHNVGTPFSFEKDNMQRQHTAEAFYAYADNAYFIDIGVPEDYRRAQKELPQL